MSDAVIAEVKPSNKAGDKKPDASLKAGSMAGAAPDPNPRVNVGEAITAGGTPLHQGKESVDGKPDGGAKKKDAEAGDHIEQKVEIDKLTGSTSIIGKYEDNHQEIKNHFFDAKESAKRFSDAMAEEIPQAVEEKDAARHICDQSLIERLTAILTEHRLLVITAEPDSDKNETAMHVAHRLRKNTPAMAHNLRRVRSLDETDRIDLREITHNRRSFGGRAVFFQDALAGENRDLRKLLRDMDEGLARSLAQDLTANETYLILTIDQYSLVKLNIQLKALSIFVPLPPLDQQRLGEGLDRALTELGQGQLLEQELREKILLHAKSVPRVERFVQEHLVSVMEGKLTVEQAFARIDKIPLWLEDLADDFDAWSFAFVLGLSQAVTGTEGTPFTDFKELWMALEKPMRRWMGAPKRSYSYRKDRISDDAMLHKTQSAIVRDPYDGCDVLRFKDPTYAARLWECFLKHSRGLLMWLLPTLRELAEGESFWPRICAARIVGRVGEIDADTIIVPTISNWAKSEFDRTRAAVGYLFEGILSSGDGEYKKRCLKELEDLGTSEQEHQLWTAVAAYKRIGAMDLTLALERLRTIAEEKLAPQILGRNEIERYMRQIKLEYNKGGHNDAEMLHMRVAHEILRRLVVKMMQNRSRLLYAIEYAIVALCVRVGTVEVFRELRKWLMGSEGLRALACLLYLQSNGIAMELTNFEEATKEISTVTSKPVISNPLIVAMTLDRQAPLLVAEFLEEIFANFNTVFPLEMASDLRGSFFGHLSTWIFSTPEYEKGRKAMEDMFVLLIASPISDLKKQTLDMFRTEEAFVKHSSPAKEFAAAVMKRGLTEAPGRARLTTKEN